MDAFGHKADKSKVNVGAMLSANNKEFYFDYQNGQYGFNTDPDRGASTFSPFNSGSGELNLIAKDVYVGTSNQTVNITITKNCKAKIIFSLGSIWSYSSITLNGNAVISSSKEYETGWANRLGTYNSNFLVYDCELQSGSLSITFVVPESAHSYEFNYAVVVDK